MKIFSVSHLNFTGIWKFLIVKVLLLSMAFLVVFQKPDVIK